MNLVYADEYGLKGSNFYWYKYAAHGISKEDILSAGMTSGRVQIDKSLVEPLLDINKELAEKGWELYIKEGLRPKALYEIVYKRRVEKYGKEVTDSLLNLKDMPHSKGTAIDIAIWDKGYGQPAMHDSVMNRASELILILERDAKAGRAFNKSYFERGKMDDIWRIGRATTEKIQGHSAVFPLNLPSKIINGWTLKDETVLDPFMGSGTTGVACMNMDRKFIGIEIESKYFDVACERIEMAQAQGKLAL